MRELINRIGFANTVVGVIGAALAVLVIGAGFDFNVNDMLEVLVTGALIVAVLGAFALLAHVVGLILEMIEPGVE